MVASFPLFFAGGYAITLQDELGISKSQFGLAVSAYFITSTIASFTIGSWIDHRGARIGFITAAIGGSLAAIAVGLSQSFWTLAVALGLAGLSNTAGQLGGNRVLAGVGARRQGAGFGVKQAAVPVGSFCAGAIVSVVGGEIDWRYAFYAYAVVAFSVAWIAPSGPGAASPDEPRRPVGRDLPFLLALAGAGSLAGATGNGLAILTVDAFGDAGFDQGVGATALAIGSAIAIVGRTGTGFLAGSRNASGFAELGGAMGLGAIGFSILAIGGTGQTLLWAGALTAFLGAWGWPGVMYYAVVRNATTTPGTATGFVVSGVFMGGIAGAPLLAVIAERWSYGAAWSTAAIMTFTAAGLVVVARELSRRQLTLSPAAA
ncbi:MAG: MFS transporter [Acidimicrobiales bacterium]